MNINSELGLEPSTAEKATESQRVQTFIERCRNGGREVQRERSGDEWFGTGWNVYYHNGVALFISDDEQAAVSLCEGFQHTATTLKVETANLDISAADRLHIPHLRPTGSEASRFALVESVPIRAARCHRAKDDCGTSYLCLSPVGTNDRSLCCEKLGEDSEIRLAALAVVYTNADPATGRYLKTQEGTLPPPLWELGYVDFAPLDFRRLTRLPDDDQTVYDIDVIMMKSDSGQFEHYFYRASQKARWLKDSELATKVESACDPFRDGKSLVSMLGKNLTPIEWKNLSSGESGE
jgi:hypothetical protein